MSDMVSVIMELIKSALTGEKASITSDVDWKKLYKICKSHQIIPLAFSGIVNSNIKFEGSEDFFNGSAQQMFLDQRQLDLASKIEEAFNKNQIEFMLLKGIVAKKLYPNSEMRTMSDIDILIKPEQYKKIEAVMLELGCEYKYESDHEIVWVKNKLVNIELHKCLVPTYNQDYYAYFGDGWRLAKIKNNGECGYAMSNEDFFIYNFVHFAKHYRGGGVGLRHFTDIWVILNAYPNMDKVYIEQELEKLKLSEFYNNVIKTLEAWFNGGTHDEISDKITDWVISGGAYGTGARRNTADTLRDVSASGDAKKAKKKRMFNLIFLPFYAMRDKYPVLKKCPFLLPVMWVVRWVDILLFKRGKIKTENQKSKNMTNQSIDEYSAELNAVGLGFNFKESVSDGGK